MQWRSSPAYPASAVLSFCHCFRHFCSGPHEHDGSCAISVPKQDADHEEHAE